MLAEPVWAAGSETDATAPARVQVVQPAAPPAPLAGPDTAPAAQQHESSMQRFVRQYGSELFDENAEIRARAAWYWYRLTYPTGKLPSNPWGRALEHIHRFVPDAPAWPLEGAPLRAPSESPAYAPIPPGLNTWTEFGPRPLDSTGTTNNAYQYGIVAGRLNVIVSDPVDHGGGAGDRAWLGFAGGGLWRLDGIRSVNCGVSPCDVSGVTATAMWESEDLTTQGVSAIEIDPTDASGNTLYVGTGDWQANDVFSSGIMKTTDGGSNWTRLGGDVFVPYSKVLPADQAHGGCVGCLGNRWSNQNVKEIAVDPHNANTVLVGTRYDLYISHDAGATWAICPIGGSYTNPESTIGSIAGISRVSGLYLDARPATTRAYLAIGYLTNANNQNNGVYGFDVPSSGCPTVFTNYFGGLPTGTGTGTSNAGRIELAGRVAGDGYLTLYAQIQDARTTNLNALGTWVMRPDDPAWPTSGGIKSWSQLTGSASTSYKDCNNTTVGTGQDWYDLHIHIHPTNDKLLYLGHIDLFKGTVNSTYSSLTLGASANLTNVYSTSCASYGKVHPDQHGFAFVEMPGDPSYGNWILVANDGGIFINTNAGDATKWAPLSKAGISTNEYYAGQIGMDFANADGSTGGNPVDHRQWLFGGMQDNGNATWDSSLSNLQWTARSVGGDGFWTAFDSLGGSLSGGTWITEYTYGSMDCSSSGADGPFTTSNCGPSYTGESPDWSTPFVMDQFHCTNASCRDLAAGGDSVWATTASPPVNTGSWTRLGSTVMPASASAGSIVTLVFAPSEPKALSAGTDNGKWWWTENGFTGANCTAAASDSASFACTPNGSTTWQQIDASNTTLPNRVIGGVAFDPDNHDIVYAAVGGFDENTPGTPGHVFKAVWGGASFTVTNVSGNLPNVPAQTIAVNPYNPNQVFLGTFFGFYYTDDITATTDFGGPHWVRYMDGLPNVPLYHFSIDRGPLGNAHNSTTLSVFTYGRGVYAIKLPGAGQSFCQNKPQAPTGVAATAPSANLIHVVWNDSATAGVTEYRVYRSSTPGGPYSQVYTVADGSPGVGGSGSYSWDDTPVSGGSKFYYVVRAIQSSCSSIDSLEVNATATGECTLTPQFAGLQTVSLLGGGQGCGLRLGWNAGTSSCGNGLTYSVYRSTSASFTPDDTPGTGNRIASCVGGTSWDDTSMPLDTSVYYIVRAEDGGAAGGGACNGGNFDTNTTRRSGYVSTSGTATLYSNDFSSSASDWVALTFGGSGDSWQGIQSCAGSIYRYGGAGCTDNYGNNNFAGRQPGNATGISVPAGATATTLTFDHRWNFQFGSNRYYDGGTLAVALDGSSTYYLVAAAALSGTAYNGSIFHNAAVSCEPTGSGNISVFGNTSTGYASNTMQSTTVDLDAACVAAGAAGGCAGHAVKIAFIGITDCATGADGWFIDNVQVTATLSGGGCNPAPQPVRFLTATGKDQQVTLEWLDPDIATVDTTQLCRSAATFPANPTDGPLTSVGAAQDAKETYADASGLTNGTPYYYAAFSHVPSPAAYSARRTVTALPIATTGERKWNFSTQAAALAPPIQGWGLGIFVPSNDRAFYGLQPGQGGGVWKSGFRPGAMNAPAQEQPLVLTTAYTGLAYGAAFLGSQDGYVYCFRADTGAPCPDWTNGRSALSYGMVQAQPMLDPATGLLLVGSRNSTGTNGFYAIHVADGTSAWSFTNAAGPPQNGDGTAMGIVSSPALIIGSRVYFTSRARAGGSPATVWALDFDGTSGSLAWTRSDVGDIDGSLTLDWNANRLIAGTNGGDVYALDPSGGGDAWTHRSFGDGPVKTFVYYDAGYARLYFASSTKVWSIPASGASGDDWSLTLDSPTRPLLHYGTSLVYVGACAQAACTDGRLVELDSADGWATRKYVDLPASGGLGPVTIDRTQSPVIAHAGSRSGRVQAVALPLSQVLP